MNYYRRNLGDYARKTGHLSMLEHGAYNMLLDRYYVAKGPIRAEHVYRVTHARNRAERAAVDAVLAEFFTRDGDVFRHARADEEIAQYTARAETNFEIAIERERKTRSRKGALKSTKAEHESLNESCNDSWSNREPNPESIIQKELKSQTTPVGVVSAEVGKSPASAAATVAEVVDPIETRPRPRQAPASPPRPPTSPPVAPPEAPDAPDPRELRLDGGCAPVPIATLPIHGGRMQELHAVEVETFERAYPEVNVRRELGRMVAWLTSNPKKRPTPAGVMRFVNGWLRRESDRAIERGAKGFQSARVVHGGMRDNLCARSERMGLEADEREAARAFALVHGGRA